MRTRGYMIAHIGNSRENHEDNYLLGEQYMLPEQVKSMAVQRKIVNDSMSFSNDFCVAVSDGMGGHECGEVASLLSVQYLSSHYNELIEETKKDKRFIECFITKINDYVCNEAKQKTETQNMGATLCGLLSLNEELCCFNVGDSRLYQYSDGILRQVTVDNTEGQRLLNLGLLTQEEIKAFPKRKAIYKYIGKDIELIPDVYEIGKVEEGTIFLLCSDGLSDVLDLNEIQDADLARTMIFK